MYYGLLWHGCGFNPWGTLKMICFWLKLTGQSDEPVFFVMIFYVWPIEPAMNVTRWYKMPISGRPGRWGFPRPPWAWLCAHETEGRCQDMPLSSLQGIGISSTCWSAKSKGSCLVSAISVKSRGVWLGEFQISGMSHLAGFAHKWCTPLHTYCIPNRFLMVNYGSLIHIFNHFHRWSIILHHFPYEKNMETCQKEGYPLVI